MQTLRPFAEHLSLAAGSQCITFKIAPMTYSICGRHLQLHTYVISAYWSSPSPSFGYALLTTMTRLCHVLRLRSMVHTVSMSQHLRFGTRCRLILRTEILPVNSSNRTIKTWLFVQAYSHEVPLRTFV